MDDEFEGFLESVTPLLRERRLDQLRALLGEHGAAEIAQLLEREDARDRAVLYRLLRRDQALEAFELLDPGMRAELIGGLREEDVSRVFEELDPDDRAQLVDELPARVAKELMRGLSPQERELTAPMLG